MKQRGLGTIELVVGVIALGIVAALLFAAKAYIDKVRDDAFAAGRKSALFEVAQRDNKDLAAALDRVGELEKQKAALEAAHRERMAQIDQKHQEDIADVHAKKDRVIAELRTRRLHDARGQTDAGCTPGSGSAGARAPDAAGQRDAAAIGQPAGPVVAEDDDEFTAGLLEEGDEAIVDLVACQAILLDWGPRLGVKVP